MKYFRPKSIEKYFSISSASSTLLAGGTDLIPHFEHKQILPETIIDLKKLPNFSGIKLVDKKIVIGSGTTIEEIKNCDLIKENLNALAQACTDFGSVQIRNRATIGGNICNASPSGDTLSPLYAFDAELNLRNKNATRAIPIDEFIVGPGKTTLKKGEFLESITIPLSTAKSLFFKLGLRAAMAIAVVNFAIVYSNTKLIIAVGAVAPTILKFSGLESLSIEKILAKIDRDISPIDDIRATAKYRRQVLRNMLEYELKKIKNNV